jgi:intracellular septation protein A
MGKESPFEGLMEQVEIHLGVFFISYGIFMAAITFYTSTSTWLFFKTAGFYLVTFIFFIGEFILLRFKIRRLVKNQQKAAALSRFNPSSRESFHSGAK